MKTQKHRLLALSACALAFCLLASGCRTSRLESSTLSLEKETDSTAAAEKTGSAESGDALTVPQLEGMLLSEASVTLEQAGLQAEYRFSAELAAAMEAAGLTALPAEDAFDDRDDNDMDDDDDDIDDVDDDVDDDDDDVDDMDDDDENPDAEELRDWYDDWEHYVVTAVEPAPGTALKPGDTVTLTLDGIRSDSGNAGGYPATKEALFSLEGMEQKETLTLLKTDDFLVYYNSELIQVQAVLPETEKAELPEGDDDPEDVNENPDEDDAYYLLELKDSRQEDVYYCSAILDYYDREEYRYVLKNPTELPADAVESESTGTVGEQAYPATYVQITEQELVTLTGFIEAPDGGALKIDLQYPPDAAEGFGARMMAYLDTLVFLD